MRSVDALKYAATVLTILVFTYLALGRIENQILGVVLLALVLWSFYPNRHFESSLLVIALIAVFEASLNVRDFITSLFNTYGASGLWIILSGFILAKAMEESGLGRRIALKIMTSMGCKPRNVILAIAVASLAIAPLSPSTTAKAFIILPICIGLVESFGVEKGRSRFGAAVMLMAMTANNICSTAFLTATVPNPISAEYIAVSTPLRLDWGEWFRMAFPITILLLAVSYLLITLMFKPEIEASKETYDRICGIRDQLGPVTKKEMIVAVMFIIALILWITERFNPFNVGLISLALSLLLFLPQAGVMEINKFSGTVPWGSIALFAATMFLARVVGKYKALDPVATGIFQAVGLGSLSPALFIGSIVLVAMMLHLIFTSTTVYATVMMPVVIGLANNQGANPILLALPVALLAPVAVILPVNTIPNIIFHTEGWFTEQQMISYGVILSLVSVAIVLLVGVPYWQLIGLI
ncbi:MAG: DASS family sodium-coupled anion symporter [Candidatus Bathyarchaeia archaeon]|jgi:anion transporter